jgi:SAM-dependent methyltransferase
MVGGHDIGLAAHAQLLADPVRIDAYDRAIRAIVRPGDVVLDVGAGTGLLSLLAARAGAARVHAVESMPVADLIGDVARANGLGDRIVVHRADLAALAPVEPVDVIVGEWLGRFVVDDEMLIAVAAASAWLKPGGRCIPGRVRAFVGLSSRPLDEIARWRRPLRGLDFSPLEPAARRASLGAQLPPAAVLGPPAVAADLRPPAVGAWPETTVLLDVAREGVVYALAGWFEAELAPGVALRSGPGSTTHWGQILWPIAPVAVEPGDVVCARIAFGADGEWTWSAEARRGERALGAHEGSTVREGWRAGPAAPPVAEAVASLSDRAVAYARNGEVGRAVALAEMALRARPTDEERGIVQENLGLFHAALGQWVDAIDCFLAVADGDLASRPQILSCLVACAVRAGWAEAEPWGALYEDRFGPWTDPWAPRPG